MVRRNARTEGAEAHKDLPNEVVTREAVPVPDLNAQAGVGGVPIIVLARLLVQLA